ncbi:MAG: VWA domain-containing protein [Bacteroidota bacterium]
MNFLRYLSVVVCVSLFSIGCSDDKDFPTSCSNYYRMEAFDVGVDTKTRKVQILYQVRDCDNKGIGGLSVNDFEVLENGFSMDSEADIRIDPGQIPYTVKTVLLLDITRSVEGLVGQIKTACNSLINQKLPNQEIAIYAFDKQLKLIQDFSTSKTVLTQAINSLPENGLENSTNLYGSIIDLNVSEMWSDVFSVQEISDGSLIIFTDGRHNANQTQTLSQAKNSIGNKRVFVAALQSSDLVEEPLKELSSNGGYFLAENIEVLEKAFLDIQAEIESLSGSIYYLFYTSPITDPTPFENELILRVNGNSNRSEDRQIKTTFNSQGFQ